MPPRNHKPKGGVRNSADRIDQELDNIPPTSQEQVLLEALLSFITPHIGTAMNANYQKEMSQKLAGPQAKKFITALKEFISSLVGTAAKTEVETTIEVALDEDDQAKGMVASPIPLTGADLSGVNVGNQTFILSKPVATEPTIYDKVLVALRSHVFNKMPIRLLRFVPKGSVLEISLIERAAIYEHLVLVLPAWPNNEYERNVIDWIEQPRMETQDEATSRIVRKYSGYAILSHTWLRETPEVTHGDWKAKSFDETGSGYRKLVNFCRVAYTKHGLTLGWMDTVCINKESSSELDESIRSMYNWYKRSRVCIVHLADTELLPNMHCDTWFTRGWTLQELLAPSVLKFYNRLWVTLVDSKNDKENNFITAKITEATTILDNELRDIHRCSPLSRRMQLAAHRKVTREEDTAYSLMGFFNVSFTTAYGEGANRAFYRLLQEILNSTSDGVLDLFNCAGTGNEFSSTSKILPSSPRQYLERATDGNLRFFRPSEPLMLTHMGIHIPLLLMPGTSIQEDNFSNNPCGNYSAIVSVSSVGYDRHIPTTYALLQQQDSRHDSRSWGLWGSQYRLTFAVFNFHKREECIVIPSRCIAIPLACDEHAGKVTSTGRFDRIYTEEPVVFDMLKRNAEEYMVNNRLDIFIPQEDLVKHGMQLVFKYV